jgi:hypothetical protein
MEDDNAAHGYKSSRNYYTRYRTEHRIILMPYFLTSPDINLIKKYWRRIKQALHRRRYQLITVAKMKVMVLEEWERILQEWINQLVLKQEY